MSGRTSRPGGNQTLQLAVIRILIASFFVGIAVGLIPFPTLLGLTEQLFEENTAITIATTFVFVTSFFIMVGRNVRTAALSLAIFLLASHIAFEVKSSEPFALAQFWQTIVLVGILVLVALILPGGSESMHVLRRIVTPRRVRPARPRPAATERAEDATAEQAPEPSPKTDETPSEPVATFSSKRTINPVEAEQHGLRLVYEAQTANQNEAALLSKVSNAS